MRKLLSGALLLIFVTLLVWWEWNLWENRTTSYGIGLAVMGLVALAMIGVIVAQLEGGSNGR